MDKYTPDKLETIPPGRKRPGYITKPAKQAQAAAGGFASVSGGFTRARKGSSQRAGSLIQQNLNTPVRLYTYFLEMIKYDTSREHSNVAGLANRRGINPPAKSKKPHTGLKPAQRASYNSRGLESLATKE